MGEIVYKTSEQMYWIGGMRAAIDSGEEQSKLFLFNLANNKFGRIVVDWIRSGQNLDARRVAHIETDATAAHSLSIDVKKVKAVEGKVRVVRERVNFCFADCNRVKVKIFKAWCSSQDLKRMARVSRGGCWRCSRGSLDSRFSAGRRIPRAITDDELHMLR